MFCQNCGASLKNDARFCMNCGSAQAVTPPVQPQTELPFAGSVLATAKKVGSSPNFLIATIFFTLTLVLNLLTLLPVSRTVAYGDFFAEFGITDWNLSAQLETLTLVTGIINMLPTVLITIGLWITFGTCVSRKPKANTAGLAIIFVVNLVLLVLFSLGLLTALFPFLLFCSHAEDAFTQAIALGIGLTVLAVFAFVLIYYIQLCTTISTIRSTLQTGVPNKRVSRFVAVMCYIGGSLVILSGMGGLLSTCAAILSQGFSFAAFLSPISNLLTGVGQILFGTLLFSYRSKMETLETADRLNAFRTLSYAEPYTAPVYTPPQPAAEPEPTPEPEVAAEPTVVAEPAVTEEPEVMNEPAVIEKPEVIESPATEEEPE